MLNPIGLIFAVGHAALGKWGYRHPERLLDKFNPSLKPHSNLVLRFIRSVGVLWMFVAVYGILAFLGQLIAPPFSDSTSHSAAAQTA
jgi:hypothetical protein